MVGSFFVWPHVQIAILLLCGVLFLWSFYKQYQKYRQLLAKIKREQQKRWLARYEDTEEGLRSWLLVLKLPQLEEETKRAEVAHQLRIVISERLMMMPDVY